MLAWEPIREAPHRVHQQRKEMTPPSSEDGLNDIPDCKDISEKGWVGFVTDPKLAGSERCQVGSKMSSFGGRVEGDCCSLRQGKREGGAGLEGKESFLTAPRYFGRLPEFQVEMSRYPLTTRI